MKIGFNIEINKTTNVAKFAGKNKSIMLQPLREKQKDHVTNKIFLLQLHTKASVSRLMF